MHKPGPQGVMLGGACDMCDMYFGVTLDVLTCTEGAVHEPHPLSMSSVMLTHAFLAS
jgi:hypothetical protein